MSVVNIGVSPSGQGRGLWLLHRWFESSYPCQGKSASSDAPFSFPGRGSIGSEPSAAWRLVRFPRAERRPLARRRQAREFSPMANIQRKERIFGCAFLFKSQACPSPLPFLSICGCFLHFFLLWKIKFFLLKNPLFCAKATNVFLKRLLCCEECEKTHF